MALGEFELIHSYFSSLGIARDDVSLGVGDDCALLTVPKGSELAVTTDTLVAGVHFYPDVDPERLGHKSLAVNLSDLAAMGARPAWFSLAITIPETKPDWLAGFSRGLGTLAASYGVQLIGGDTTKGPLSITIQALGLVPQGRGLLRSGARVGDHIYVTGNLGDAGMALRDLKRKYTQCVDSELLLRLEKPEPRVEAGLALRDLATSGIDLSDGLVADLKHVLELSGVGAKIQLAKIPLSPPVRAVVAAEHDWSLPLTSGDDYELCLTLPSGREEQVRAISQELALPITHIGEILTGTGLHCCLDDGNLWYPTESGFTHFSSDE